MSTTKGLKAISPVPTASDFLDIVLNKTQRKTPTVSKKCFVQAGYKQEADHTLGYSQELQDQPHPKFLHAKGQVHPGLVR